MRPAITVGVAVYNIDCAMLTECLDSVIDATDDSCEVIIVDDCSTNGCEKICREYAQEHPRISLIRNPHNCGIGRVRNIMIDAARGERILFVDGDDVIAPGAVQSAAVCGDADVIIYDFAVFDGECRRDGASFSPEYVEISAQRIEELAVACLAEAPCDIAGRTVSKGCTVKSFRRELLIENNIRFIEDLKISEDSLFFADVLCQCKKAVYFPFTLYYYRHRNGTSVTNRYNADMAELRRLYLKYFDEKWQEHFGGRTDLSDLQLKYKIPSVIYRQFKLDTFHRGNPKSYWQRKREFNEFLSEEPYAAAIRNFDCKACAWHERALIFALAKRRRFFALNALFHHPILLKIYGWGKNKLSGN